MPFFGRRTGALSVDGVVSRRRKQWAPWSAAAAVVVALAIWVFGNGDLKQTKYSTPIGGVAAIPLSDGSQVVLNTNSEIRVAVTKSERRINLLQGEAFFDVARDPERPFFVLAGARKVVALGTRFSVRRERDEVQIVVTEGRVRVEDENAKGSQQNAPLTAGAIVRTHGNTIAVQQRSAPEAEEILTWRSGFLVFKDIPLSDAVAEFNRYTAREIAIEDPAIASIRIGGNFRTANVGAFLRILQADFPIRVTENAERVVLTKNSR